LHLLITITSSNSFSSYHDLLSSDGCCCFVKHGSHCVSHAQSKYSIAVSLMGN